MTRNALTDMGGYSPYQAGTTGTMTAYEPTWRNRLSSFLMGDTRPSPERNRLIRGITGASSVGDSGFGLLDVTPAGIPMQAQEAYRAGDDRMLAMALMPGPKKPGIKVFHSSPHNYDKPDISKIGTGEGAQAYGHGLYASENPAVSGPEGEYYKKFKAQHGKAYAYEWNVKAEPDDFLDWDRPFSQQPEKARTILDAEVKRNWEPDTDLNDKMMMQDVLRDRDAVKRLGDAGVPGIRYLDQGSRTAGEGSRNYVLFRDDIIEISKKYGVAFATTLYGAEAVKQAMNQE